jgi:hypothetical protein
MKNNIIPTQKDTMANKIAHIISAVEKILGSFRSTWGIDLFWALPLSSGLRVSSNSGYFPPLLQPPLSLHPQGLPIITIHTYIPSLYPLGFPFLSNETFSF